MDEFTSERIPWNLDAHLNGCLVGYQTAPSYGTAVFFALEALWGIARDIGVRAEAGKLDPKQLDKDWIVSPRTNLEVPWIWIRSLATAWEKYKSEGGPLGQAFGLEGGQGKPPISDKLMQMLDERLDLVTHPGDPSGWREDAHRRCRAGGRREIRQERRHDQTGLAAVRSA